MRETMTPTTIATQPTINAISSIPISHRFYAFSRVFVPEDDERRHRRRYSRPNERRPPPRADGIYHSGYNVGGSDPEDQRTVEAFLVTKFRFRRSNRSKARDRGHIEGDKGDQGGNRDIGGEDHGLHRVYALFRSDIQTTDIQICHRNEAGSQGGEGGYDVFLCDESCDCRHNEYPTVLTELATEAKGREERLNELCHACQDAFVDRLILEEMPVKGEVCQEPNDDSGGENDRERLFQVLCRRPR